MATYLEITNRALREINEVPLTSGGFTTARGIQEFIKGAVSRAYFDISSESVEWPWLHNTVTRTEGTEVLTLTAGTQWYNKSATELEVDWQSFYVTDKDPSVVSTAQPEVSGNLTYITYDDWVRMYREVDNERTLEVRGTPKYVVRHPNGKLGFSPAPDETLYVEYFVWRTATAFVLESDEIPFPEEFETVLMSRIRYYAWLFRENDAQAAMAREDYKGLLTNMKRIVLSNKSERMRAV